MKASRRTSSLPRHVALAVLASVVAATVRADWPLSGQLTLHGSAGFTTSDSAFRGPAGDPLLDDSENLRLMYQKSWGAHWQAEAHLDLGAAAGDSRAAASERATAGATGALSAIEATGTPNDGRRVMDLTHLSRLDDRGVAYERLDRLNLRWTPDWGSVTIGRAAITWGDGLIFNVQDLFNPFDPRDIERDYKTGDDLLLVEARAGANTWQFLAVPRRDPASGALSRRQSSFAVRGRFPSGGDEWSVLAASHYNGWVGGLGRVMTLGGAVWRNDLLVTKPDGGDTGFAALTNLDYSWVSLGRNCYGLVEAYYDNRGAWSPRRALEDPDLLDRVERGETFTLGRAYVAGSIDVEFHPLVHGTLSVIADLQGPSAFWQPRVVWDARENLQFTLGASLPVGAPGTEYGGVIDPQTGKNFGSPAAIVVWAKAWF